MALGALHDSDTMPTGVDGVRSTTISARLVYSAQDVAEYWADFDARGREHERIALLWDLGFPAIYGAAFALALFAIRRAGGFSFGLSLVLLPIIAVMAADWSENSALLCQLRRFVVQGEAGLQPGWIKVASTATATKLTLLAGLTAATLALGAIALTRASSRREGQ